MPLAHAAAIIACIFILMGCASLIESAEGQIEDAEVLSDKAGAIALDYICNRMRIRVLRELVAISPERLEGWSALCPPPQGNIGTAVVRE